jgi:hypothetical protein
MGSDGQSDAEQRRGPEHRRRRMLLTLVAACGVTLAVMLASGTRLGSRAVSAGDSTSLLTRVGRLVGIGQEGAAGKPQGARAGRERREVDGEASSAMGETDARRARSPRRTAQRAERRALHPQAKPRRMAAPQAGPCRAMNRRPMRAFRVG